MLSKKTLIEIANHIDSYTSAELDRIALVFQITMPVKENELPLSKSQQVNTIFSFLNANNSKGPFTGSIQIDFLQYIVEKYNRDSSKNENSLTMDIIKQLYVVEPENIDEQFIKNNPRLYNSINEDGFTIRCEKIVALSLEKQIELNEDS